MSQTPQEKSKRYFAEMTYEELMAVDVDNLDATQLREYLSIIQRETRSAQTKRSKNVKVAKKLSGKSIDASKFI